MTKLFSIILISCLGTLVYSNTFHSSFHYDDASSITGNFVIRNIADLQDIWNFWPCRFMTYLSFAFNYQLNGLDVSGYHIFNLAVHLFSAILVWWLMLLTFSTPVMNSKGIGKNAPVRPDHLIALFAGLIFVSHPIQTQAVTYVVQRAASLATLFYLATLCFYVKSRMGDRKGRPYYILSLITAMAAMFSKEIAITLPLTLALYEYCFFKIKNNFNWKPLVPFLFILAVIPLTMLLTRSVDIQQMHRVTEDSQGVSSIQYLLTEFRVIVTYIRLVFLPLGQNVDYDYPVSQSFFELPTLLSFLFLTVVLLLAQRAFLKYRLVSFSIFWFFLTLLPESSVIPIKDVIYEHRLYLPLVGYSMFLASAVYYLIGKKTIQTMVVVLALIISCNSVLTFQRNEIWKDEFTLWNDAVQKSPHKARPYSHRGTAYFDQGNWAQAISDYNKSLELDPTDVQTYNDRGNVYAQRGDFTRALADFNKALELHPNFAEPYYNRGLIYSDQGDFTRAIFEYNKAIEFNPNYGTAYNNRAICYYQLKEYDHAWDDLHKAEALGYGVNPGFIKALTQSSGREE